MKKFVYLIVAVSLLAAVSCGGGNRQAKSPFTKKELVSDRKNAIRAEGTGTANNIRAAMSIARMNAMTSLAGKLASVITDTSATADGGVRYTEKKDAVINNAIQIDQRVFENEKDGTVTVWILLETEIDN